MKEPRRAQARTLAQANGRPGHDRRVAVAPRVTTAGGRPLGRDVDRASILSARRERGVSNGDVVRFANRPVRLRPPPRSGWRGGRVVVAERLAGTRVIRFGGHELRHREIDGREEKTAGEGTTGETANRKPRRPPPGAGPHKPATDHPWRTGGKR